jgi:hypothetical protein
VKSGTPVVFEQCPQRLERTLSGRIRRCRCGRCRVCGFQKHSAIHGGKAGHEGEPMVYGHEFEPIGMKEAM